MALCAADLNIGSELRLYWCAVLGLNQSAGLLNLSPTNGGTVTDDLDAVIDAVATIEDASGMDQGPRACREGGSRGSGHDRRGAEDLRRDHETGPQVADAVKSHHHDQEVWAFAKSKITLMLF